MSRSVWSALGLAPTDDRRAIKRAYAAKLKAIDVDQDPDAFIALRHTLELALRLAEHPQLVEEEEAQEEEQAPEQEEDDWESRSHPAPDAGSFNLSFIAIPGWTVAPEQPSDTPAFAALETLLYETDDPARIAAATEALLASPALQSIDGAQDAEIWCARTILAHMPRADPMIVPAMHRFGWLEEDRNWTRRDIVARVMARHRDRWFLHDIAQPGHEHHRAWQALSRPFVARGAGRIAGRVETLLKMIRGTHRTLLQDLDAESIARWDDFLCQPRLSRRFWPITLLAPLPVLALTGGALATAPSLLLVYLLLAGSAAGAQAATLRIERWSAAVRETDWDARDAHPLAWGWIPALLLLPIAAALIPPSPVATIILAASAVALAAIAAAFRDEPDSGERARNRRWYPIAALAWWALAAAFAPSAAAWVQVTAPLLATSWIATIAAAHVAEILERLRPARLRAAIGGTAAGMTLAIGWIGAALPAPAPPAILILVPLALIAMAALTRAVHLQLGWIGTVAWLALVVVQNMLSTFVAMDLLQTAAISTACFAFGIGYWRLFRAWQAAR